jgi:hypothetical protein
MAAKYFNFVDGQRLPGDRVKEFLMNQAVIQCENQTEITGSGIELLGARVAINLEDGQLWTYTPDIEAWAPAQNTLDLDLLDARYYTKIAADGVFISETTADARYLTEVTARGIFLTQTDGDTKYYTKLQADGLFLTSTSGDSRYYTKLQADGLFLTQTSGDGRYYTKLQADGLYLGKTEAGTTYVTKVDAGSLYIAKTDNAGTYVTSISGDKITTGSIDANLITSGELVGRTIRTVPAGNTAKRIIINTQGEIVFFNSGSSSEAGRLEATAAGLSVNGASGGNLASSGTPVVGWSATEINLLQNTDVVGRMRASGQVQSNNGACIMGANITTSGNISADGTLSISGTSTFSSTLSTNGLRATNLQGTGTVNATLSNLGFFGRGTSSARYKQDIQNLQVDYNDVINMQPKTYRRIDEVEQLGDDAVTYGGFIAEDLAGTSLDPFVVYMKDGDNNLIPDGIHYGELTAALVSVIKEQDTRLNALEARIAALEGGAQ